MEENADCGKELHDQEGKHIEDNLTARRRVVAFTAVKTADQKDLGPGQIITFETVIFNRGGGYRPQSSYFIAPRNGVYMFSATLLVRSYDKSFYGEIVHNGNTVARIHATANVWDSGSQTVVIEVRAGDNVWIRSKDGSNYHINGDLFC